MLSQSPLSLPHLYYHFSRLGEEIRRGWLVQTGLRWCCWRSVCPHITIGPLIVEGSPTTVPLDVHLMIVEPEKVCRGLAKAGADHITVHAEHNARLTCTASNQRTGENRVVLTSTPLDLIEHARGLWLSADYECQPWVWRWSELSRCIAQNPQTALDVWGARPGPWIGK